MRLTELISYMLAKHADKCISNSMHIKFSRLHIGKLKTKAKQTLLHSKLHTYAFKSDLQVSYICTARVSGRVD